MLIIFYNYIAMKKFKYFIFLIIYFPLFLITSCKSNANIDYKIDLNSSRLVVNDDNFKNTGYKANDTIDDFNKLVVKFDDRVLTYDEKVNENDRTYFISTSNSDPKNNVLKNSATVNSSATIFVAFKTEVNSSETYFLKAINITADTSSNTVTKWITYVIVGLVIVSFAVLSYLKSKKKEDKKEKKPSLISPLTEEEKKECLNQENKEEVNSIDNIEIKEDSNNDKQDEGNKEINLDITNQSDDEEIK